MSEAIKQSLLRHVTAKQADAIIKRGTVQIIGQRVQLHVTPSDVPLAGNMVIEAQL